jgi:hypothetical protein
MQNKLSAFGIDFVYIILRLNSYNNVLFTIAAVRSVLSKRKEAELRLSLHFKGIEIVSSEQLTELNAILVRQTMSHQVQKNREYRKTTDQHPSSYKRTLYTEKIHKRAYSKAVYVFFCVDRYGLKEHRRHV